MGSDGAVTSKRNTGHPLTLAAAGVLSLVVCAVAGWMLRSLRQENPPASSPTPVNAVRSTERSEPRALARGRLTFQVHCARCHGPGGRGDGPDAASLRPPPRDLVAGPWRTPATRDAVRRAVAEGIPGTMMTAMAAALSPSELDAVVDFVLSIAPGGAPNEQSRSDVIQRAGFTPARTIRLAPSITARSAGGAVITLDKLKGKLVLIVFWGTSCAPCLDELPALESLARRFREQGLEVVPVCVDEPDAAAVCRVAGDRAPGLPVFTDPTGTAALAFGVQALPAAALIAPDGSLLGQSTGTLDWSSPQVDALIRASLGVR